MNAISNDEAKFRRSLHTMGFAWSTASLSTDIESDINRAELLRKLGEFDGKTALGVTKLKYCFCDNPGRSGYWKLSVDDVNPDGRPRETLFGIDYNGSVIYGYSELPSFMLMSQRSGATETFEEQSVQLAHNIDTVLSAIKIAKT